MSLTRASGTLRLLVPAGKFVGAIAVDGGPPAAKAHRDHGAQMRHHGRMAGALRLAEGLLRSASAFSFCGRGLSEDAETLAKYAGLMPKAVAHNGFLEEAMQELS